LAVVAIDRLQECEARDLDEVLVGDRRWGIAPRQLAGERQIPQCKLLPRRGISSVAAATEEQLGRTGVQFERSASQKRRFRRHSMPPFLVDGAVWHHRAARYQIQTGLSSAILTIWWRHISPPSAAFKLASASWIPPMSCFPNAGSEPLASMR